MDLKSRAASLGIEKYPAGLEEVFPTTDLKNETVCNADTLRALHERYGIFGDYLEEILKGAEEVLRTPALLAWLNLSAAYCKNLETMYEASKMPMPPLDGSVARNVFPALLLADEAPVTAERYRARGFDEAQISLAIGNVGRNLWVHLITEGKVGISQGLYGWLTHYSKAVIFDHKGLNFQPAVWKTESLVLKHKETGEIVILMMQGRFSPNGLLLGSAGADGEEGAFDAEFSEQIHAFFGHPVKNGRVQATLRRFDKSEWRAVLRPGDDVINLHIPRNGDFSPAAVDESLREGFALCERYYPELSFKAATCCSWMLDPEIANILGEGSKITSFARRFELHPVNDTVGRACMGFVFPGEHCSVEELPERTTLQRGVKKLFLDGGFNQWTTGVMTDTLA